MNLFETIAIRRSGHHAVMSWYVKNLIGSCDYTYLVTVQRDTKSIVWNDGGYKEEEIDLIRGLKFTPKNLFINYEDRNSKYTFFEKDLIYKGPYRLDRFKDISIERSKRVIVIRDFYNVLCSRITQNKKQEFQMGVDIRFINLWKNHAKSIINNETHYIKYEDWLTNEDKRVEFLKNTFNIKEIFKKEHANGTHSSYDGDSDIKDYLNRFDPNIIPEEVKKLIREDNELHYLIGALGYTYRKI